MAGVFIVFEGGDRVGKSTQARLLAQRLTDQGHDVVLTFEPGDTRAGAVMRQIVLDPATGDLAPRAEALLYAADKAHHVYEVILPALERGAIVISDRYVDSLLAYQGAGRGLGADRLESIANWATGGLLPDLTILLDLDPSRVVAGIEDPDRLESAGLDFHARVREEFLKLAERDPEHYLVLPARTDKEGIAAVIADRVAELVSPPTGTLG